MNKTVKITKRNGNIVDLDENKISIAIQHAMSDLNKLDVKKANKITEKVVNLIKTDITVDEVQNLVEKTLIDEHEADIAKSYIIYRYERDKQRNIITQNKNSILTDDFISKYKHMKNPMTELGNFVYYRTYSRWIPELNRREQWYETVRRAVEYNCALLPTTRKEAEELYDNIFHLRQFLSGRTFWVGGTPVSTDFPISNFNCAFQIIDRFDTFKDLFYLLIVGSGVGIRILKEDVEKLPKIKIDFEVIQEAYEPIEKSKRKDYTSLLFNNNDTVKIIVGDSKEGWVEALGDFLDILTSRTYKKINTIIINYDNVRGKGEKLKTFGGTASGHESLKNMFIKITNILKSKRTIENLQYAKLKTIDCLDMANIIGENVVVGGVRRCQPKGSLVSTDKGLIPIEDIKIGDMVLTTQGYHPVTDWVEQGKQELITIKTQIGEFKCTPKHKMAKLIDSENYEWVFAKDLKDNDKLVFVKDILKGKKQDMPKYNYTKKESDNTSITITIPKLDENMSWFLGYLHGDGYISKNEICIAISDNLKVFQEKCINQLKRFNVNPRLSKAKDGNYSVIRVKSVQLCDYLLQFKQPNVPINIPKYINSNTPNIRASYLQGLYDSDGSTSDHPIISVTSIYKSYLIEVQGLYATLGIPTRLKLKRSKKYGWKDLYALSIVGKQAKKDWKNLIAKYGQDNSDCKYIDLCKTDRSQNGYIYPDGSVYKDEKLIPINVDNVKHNGKIAETYDISVDSVHEFVSQNLLTHNTAEIALIDPDDESCINAKSGLYKQVGKQWVVDESILHRQMSNNSIYYKEKPTRDKLHWQIEKMRYSGEPAWVNEIAGAKRRDNMNGVNPSMPKDVLVQTLGGIYHINELEGKEFFVKSLNGDIAKAQCWLSSDNTKVYDIDFKGGRHSYATAKHKFPILDSDGNITRKAVSEIVKGDRIPLNRNELQGFSKNLSYEDGLIAGLFIGDGSITKRKDDGRYVASFTVSDKDIEIKDFIDKIYTQKTGCVLKWNRRDENSKSQETNFGKQEFVKKYLIDKLGLNLSIEGKSLPNCVWSNGDDYAIGVINGLFSTDGSVNIDKNKDNIRVELTTSQSKLADEVQKLLSFYGISSCVSHRKTKPTFPNKKIYNREYTIFAIRINGNQVLRFNNIFNFINENKQQKINSFISKLIDVNYITVDSVTYRSSEPVWDISVEHNQHVFPSQHCYTGNCGEVLLDSKGLCNLTTVNVFSFVKEDNTLDVEGLLKAQRLSAKAGYRMSSVQLELPEWNNVQVRDRLLGCSLTGWQDMVNATNMTKEQQKQLLNKLREEVHLASKIYANETNGNVPLLSTLLKPEGTLSQLPTVSSGIHYSHSPYYIRRVRISATDPLVKVCEELEYPIFPEVGQTIENCTTKVIEFPIKAPEGVTKYDVSALEQLENYKMFMDEYIDHNASCTIHVRNDEWDIVEDWIWDNWDEVVGLSFLSLDDSFYELLPYESITKEEYEKRAKAMNPFIANLLQKYEKNETETEIAEDDQCAGGACPIR